MKRVGRRTKINIAANKILKEKYLKLGIERCEIRLSGCLPDFALGFAHRHKRVWYYSCPELLSEVKETLLSCPNCHAKIEVDKQLTEEVFQRLRSPERLKELLK